MSVIVDIPALLSKCISLNQSEISIEQLQQLATQCLTQTQVDIAKDLQQQIDQEKQDIQKLEEEKNVIKDQLQLVYKPSLLLSYSVSLTRTFSQNQEEEEIQDFTQTDSYVYHFLGLFSNPLLQEVNGRLVVRQQLNHDKEKQFIKNVLKHTYKQIKYKFDVGRTNNIKYYLQCEPILGIHYSGHSEADKKDYMVLEDNDCLAQTCDEQLLGEFLSKMHKIKPEFVFLASCHSEKLGGIFLQYGVKHVIAVKREVEIEDNTAIEFAKTFYSAFFSCRRSVCKSFEIAEQRLQASMNIPEDQKKNFVLLCNPGHKCTPIWIDEGDFISETYKPEFTKIPSKIDNFLGRPKELYQLYQILNRSRLVTLKGAPGIGKTSVVKMIANSWLDRCEREGYADGILYLSCMSTQNCEGLLQKIDENTNLIKLDKNYDNVEERVLAKLQDRQFLLILDGVEEIITNSIDSFRQLLIQIYEECQFMRFLIVSRQKIDLQYEEIFELNTLSPLDCFKLFKAKSSRPISKVEIGELLKEDVTNLDNNQINEKMSQHELIQLLHGHPQSITLAASLLYQMKLTQLYESLKQNMILTLEGSFGQLQQKNPLFSLSASFNTSALQILQQYGEKAINFFCLFGILPAGGSIELLNAVFQQNTEQYIGQLLDSSLIIVKEHQVQNQEERWYTTYPIIQIYAENLITQDDFAYYSQIILHFFTEKSKSIYNQIATNSGDYSESLKKQIEFLFLNDENIFECLERKLTKQTKLKKLERVKSLTIEKNKINPIQVKQESQAGQKIKQLLAKGFKKKMLQASDYQEEQKVLLNIVKQTLKSTQVKKAIREKQKGSLLLDEGKKQVLNFIQGLQKKKEQSSIGKLVSYYVTILILNKNFYNAMLYIQQTLPVLSEEKDFQNKANLLKLLAFIKYLNVLGQEQNISQIVEILQDAKDNYKQSANILGKAITNIFLSLCYHKQGNAELEEKMLQHAIKQYSLMNHKAGLSMSHKLLKQANIEPEQNEEKEQKFQTEAVNTSFKHGMGQLILRNIYGENNLLYSLILELPIGKSQFSH